MNRIKGIGWANRFSRSFALPMQSKCYFAFVWQMNCAHTVIIEMEIQITEHPLFLQHHFFRSSSHLPCTTHSTFFGFFFTSQFFPRSHELQTKLHDSLQQQNIPRMCLTIKENGSRVQRLHFMVFPIHWSAAFFFRSVRSLCIFVAHRINGGFINKMTVMVEIFLIYSSEAAVYWIFQII